MSVFCVQKCMFTEGLISAFCVIINALQLYTNMNKPCICIFYAFLHVDIEGLFLKTYKMFSLPHRIYVNPTYSFSLMLEDCCTCGISLSFHYPVITGDNLLPFFPT